MYELLRYTVASPYAPVWRRKDADLRAVRVWVVKVRVVDLHVALAWCIGAIDVSGGSGVGVVHWGDWRWQRRWCGALTWYIAVRSGGCGVGSVSRQAERCVGARHAPCQILSAGGHDTILHDTCVHNRLFLVDTGAFKVTGR